MKSGEKWRLKGWRNFRTDRANIQSHKQPTLTFFLGAFFFLGGAFFFLGAWGRTPGRTGIRGGARERHTVRLS